MTRTTSPAPYGAPGLEFGNTTESPYSAARPHGGQDHQWRYADPSGSKRTFASVTGRVTAAFNDGGNHNGWGNYVDIDVPTTDGSSVFARLAHHATGTVQVRVNDWVVAGVTPIGVMGDTGEAGGVHLHEELWINGRRVDPIYYRTHDIPGTPTSAGTDARPLDTTTPNLQEDDMAGLIQHKDRGIALIAPGYFKAVTPEELPIAVSRYGWPKIYDDSQVGAREFDLDVSLAVNGSGGDQQVRSELERSRDAVLKAINGMRGSV